MDKELILKIKAHLNDFWDEQSILVDVESTSIDELVAAMDSKTAVEVLMDVEDMVEMELPVGDVIRQGGYQSREDFVEGLTESIVKYVLDKKS